MGREVIIGQEMPQWKHSAARYGHVTTVCGGHQPCHPPEHLMYTSARKMGHQEKAFLERSGSLQQSTVDTDLGPVSTHSSNICSQPPIHQGCRQDLTVSPRLGNPALSTNYLLPATALFIFPTECYQDVVMGMSCLLLLTSPKQDSHSW